MATAIAKAVTEVNPNLACKKLEEIPLDDPYEAGGLIVGSPSYL